MTLPHSLVLAVDATFSETLPEAFRLTGDVTLNADCSGSAGALTITPSSYTSCSYASASRTLTVIYDGANQLATDFNLTYTGYIPKSDASGNDWLVAATGAKNSTNVSDPETVYTATASINGAATLSAADRLTTRAINVYKSVAFGSNDIQPTGDYNPGDEVEFTIRTTVSDYFSFKDFHYTDVPGDGLSLYRWYDDYRAPRSQ